MGNYSPSGYESSRVVDKDNICPTVKENHGTVTGVVDADTAVTDNTQYRIRKLTPKECWRLMGFSDDAFDRAKQAMNEKCYGGKDRSSSQLYKQAGNSIVTDVLYYIFKELYTAMPYLFDDLKVSSYFSGIGAFEVALDRLFADVNGMNQPEPVFRGGVT